MERDINPTLDTNDSNDFVAPATFELGELQLALVGGGCAETIL